MFTVLYFILCAISYIKEKDLRVQCLNEMVLNNQRNHFENILNGNKIGFLVFDGKNAYFNKSLEAIINKFHSPLQLEELLILNEPEFLRQQLHHFLQLFPLLNIQNKE